MKEAKIIWMHMLEWGMFHEDEWWVRQSEGGCRIICREFETSMQLMTNIPKLHHEGKRNWRLVDKAAKKQGDGDMCRKYQ